MPGYLALVLHAHLPYVRHPEHGRFLEEHWLFEAITDCYLPLIEVLLDLADLGGGPILTLSLSPTLIAMLGDPLLQARFRDYLTRRTRLCEAEVARHRGEPRLRVLAQGYRQDLGRLGALYLDRLGGDLVSAFADLARAGVVELITTAATHGYLPLLRTRPEAVRAQLGVAQDAFRAAFGHPSRGLWLPECGYFEGLQGEVAAAGFAYFVIDTQGLLGARPTPPLGVLAPVAVGDGVACFGRDPDSAREVWSPTAGYPGHPDYREYHSDLGLTLDPAPDSSPLGDFLPPGVRAAPTGIKYHRVTGGHGPKDLYDPAAGARQAEADATTFLTRRRAALSRSRSGGPPPILVCPYDAELFGHWWHEGPRFLASVFAGLAGQWDLQATSLGAYLARHGTSGVTRPVTSSWGEYGYNAAWLTRETGWIYPLLHVAGGDLTELTGRHLAHDPSSGQDPDHDRQGRILRQAARSLLLAQASDWPFQIARGTAADYARARLRDHLVRLKVLTDAARGAPLDPRRLEALEALDNPFPTLDLTRFL
jgi:1,4-alpha-glucan branching enzyme